MGLLDSKVALVTGGSRNIGRAIALKFAAEGASVAITYGHDDAAAQAVVAAIQALGAKAKAYKSDAASFEGAHSTVQAVFEDFGKIDILVNNAGIVRDALMLRMSEEDFDKVIGVDLKSAFNYTHAVAPFMVRARSGSIISISSIVGLSGNAGQANYAAAKAGVIALSKTMAKEISSRGVRSNCIAPGFITSDMTDAMPQAAKDCLMDSIPMKRPGTVDEVAGVALFLASDLSSYVNGQVIQCDGGLLI